MPTLIYCTGFEYGLARPSINGLGLFNDITNPTTWSIQSAIKNSGEYALSIAPSVDTGWGYRLISGSPTTIVARIYFQFTTFPSADTFLFQAFTNGGAKCGIGFQQSSGKIYAQVDVGAKQLGPVLETGVMYRVDFKAVCSANPHTVDWQFATGDGAGAAQTQATDAFGAGVFTRFYIGNMLAVTMVLYVDDIAVSATAADYPLGPGATIGLRPVADGVHNNAANIMEDSAGNDIDSATYKACDKLDENPWITTANADYVRQTGNGTGNYCEVLFADTTEQTILGAMGLLQYASAGTAANNGGCIIIDEDGTETTLWGKAGALADYSESSAFYKSVIMPKPTGGWDRDAVNALKARFGYSSDADPDPYWLAMMVEVAYVPTLGAAWIPKVIGPF